MKKRFFLAILLFSITNFLFVDETLPGTDLAAAIDSGDLGAVKLLIEGGTSANTVFYYETHSMSPLMKACSVSDEISNYLIDAGADVNFASDSGETALFEAVRANRLDIIQKLINKGAQVNKRDNQQFSPLMVAAVAGYDDIVQALISAGADVEAEASGMTPLMLAVSSKNKDTAGVLVGHGALVNHVSAVSGETALFFAIRSGNSEMIQTLINLHADVNFRTKDGDTPIKAAQRGNQNELVTMLMAAGAVQ